MKEKGFAPIYLLIGLLIAVAIGGAYYFGKSQSQIINLPANPPTADDSKIFNFNTYTNNNLGFSFQYPKTYTLKKLGDNEIIFTKTPAEAEAIEECINNKKLPECNNYSLKISFKNLDNSQNKTLEEFIKTYDKSNNNLGYSVITLGGLSALEKQFEGIGLVKNIFVDRSQNILYIQANTITDTEENMLVFNQILPTFKFLDENNNEIKDWKTYTGKPILNFTVKYPSNWQVFEDYNDYYKNYQGVSIKEDDSNYFSIFAHENSDNETPEKFAEGMVGGCQKSSYKSSIIVDGIKSLMYLPDPNKLCNGSNLSIVNQKIDYYKIYIPKDKMIYGVVFSGKQADLLQQILSTFKFN